MAEATKFCTTCETSKSLDEFHRAKTKSQGRAQKCKECQRAYHRRRYLANREAILARTGEYQRADPERTRNYSRKYHGQNREKRRAYANQYRASDPTRTVAQAAAFRARHPDKSRRDQHRRRAMLNQVAHDPAVTVDAVRQRDGDSCCYCPTLMTFDCPNQYNPRRATLEHITPVSRGGGHTFDNVALACRACNISKRNSLPIWEWVGRTVK